jgi:hypothetical protein
VAVRLEPAAERRVGAEFGAVRRHRVPVVHRRGPRPHRGVRGPLFSTVFLGSGLLFLASLFAATAVAGGLVTSYDTAPPGADVWTFGWAATYAALNVYAVKMAGVFMISTATISWS